MEARISSYITSLIQQEKALTERGGQRREKIGIEPDDFKNAFIHHANILLRKVGRNGHFVINETNKEFLNDLFYYMNRYVQYSGDLDKGILLVGNIGVGKSLIMNSYINLHNDLSQRKYTAYHSKDLARILIEEKGVTDFHRRAPLLIDDLGKEVKSGYNFGQEILPMNELLSSRYDTGAITLATANNNMNSFEGYYGKAVSSRMHEMFNVHVLTGDDWRKRSRHGRKLDT